MIYKIFIGVIAVGLFALGTSAYADNNTVSTISSNMVDDMPSSTPTPAVVAEEIHPPDSEQLPGPVIDPNYVPGQERNDPRILPPAPEYVPLDPSPFIGDSATLFSVGMGHVCGWDTTALGGWGWDICGTELFNYISLHCSANDGVVHEIRCVEWSEGRLPIAY